MGKVIVKVGLANVNSEKFFYSRALVDTGADITVLPLSIAQRLNLKIRGEEWIRTGNEPIKVGISDVKVILNDHLAYTTVWINPKIDKILIGVVLLEQMGLKVNPLKKVLEKEQQVMYLEEYHTKGVYITELATQR